MSQEVINLDDGVEESFQFQLSGNVYVMRYPTTEEVEKSVKMKDEERVNWMYSFISPVNEGSPSIEDALKKVNVKKLQAFTKMISEQFGS